MRLTFILSMPHRASWNGRWSGEDEEYKLVRNVPKRQAEKLLESKSFYHHWSDGWSACVTVRAANPREKSTQFSGYDWMVDSILRNGEIKIRDNP